MSSLVLCADLISKSPSTFYLTSMKLLAIFILIYKLAYWNNSNDILHLLAMCMYFADTKVDGINVSNRLSLLVLYNMLLKELRGITTSSAAFIQKESFNWKLVGM